MIKRLLNRLSLSRILSILVLSLLLPSTTWAEDTEPPITVAGIEPNSDGVFINGNGTQISGVTYTDNTLSLSGANIDGNIISNTEALTINFQGTNTINGSLYINNQIEGTLSFTGSNDATLTLDNSGSGSVIYNFKSVDFGGYNLATTSSPGIFYIVNEPNGNPNQLWSNNIMGYASNVTLTKKTIYPLWIGTYTSSSYQTFTQVTEDNYTDILGNGNICFDKDHTLTLSGATISGSIISGLSSLNIVVDKANSVQINGDSATCIRNIKPGATLTLQKKQNSEAASLTVQGGWLIRDFKSISYSEGGLNLSAYYRTGQDSNPVDLLISDAYYADNDFRTSSDYRISYVKFSNGDPSFLVMIGNTTITTTPTTINASGNNDLLGEDGSVTLSVDDKGNYILTIDNASTNITSTNRKDIVSTLPNMTIKYKGSCQIGKIISTYFNAPLTFGLAEGAGGNDFLCWSLGKSILPWEGFSTTPTFNDNLCFLPNDDSQYIQKLSAPQFSMDGSKLYFSLSGNHLDQMHIFYSVDYVEGDDVESEEYNDNNPQTINKPCTVTAYTEFEDTFNIKRHSDTVTGKYFGFTEPMKIEFAGTQRDIRSSEFPKLLPETEGATYILRLRGNNSIIDEGYDEITDTGTPIVKGLGILEMEADFRFANDPDFTVLNKYTYIPVRVVPTKPTINYESEREYLNTDVIDITKNDQINGSEVYYSWTNGNDSTLYDSSNKGNLITGTLTAWTAAPYLDATGAQATILSDKTTQVFTTKNNISVLNYSEINSQTYTGSAIEPQITISSNGESQLTKDVDYTIAYSNNTNVASTESTSPPTITITGIGDYRGTKTINFNINQADFTNVTIGTIDPQTYTGNNLTPTIVVKLGENNVNASDYSISYTKNDVAVTEIIDAGTYCATLISTNKNFSTTSTKSTTFTINKATISPKVTFEGWIYGATANTPSVSGNTGNGEVTYAYKLQNEAESAFAAALPTNAGTYTIKASIAATTNYEAAVDSTHFTIAKANIAPTVTLEGWTFGATAKTPSISGNTGNGSVTYEYKLQNAEDSKYSTEVPNEAGDYTIKATIAATANYEAAVDSTHFTISKANINPTVTLVGWTFGATANTPEVTGNTGNGAETFTYKAEGSEAFTSEVPTAVGTHIVKVTIAETTNYNGGEATATFTITNRTIDPAKDITFAEGQSYASFYSSSEDLELPEEGIAVFMITGLNGNTLTTQAVSYIPKGVPVLVMKASGTTQAIDPNEVSSNMLQYATSNVTADGTAYILYNGEYVRATGTIPAGKCYLKLNKPSGARILTIGNNNGTTSISNFNADTETDRWFDLNGQRISKPQKKGLYIKNGKKIVVK